jgi:hypothetical protein
MITQRTRGHKNKFARRVFVRLLDLNMSVSQLAEKIGRPRQTVSTAIHGQSFPRVRKAVAETLGIKPHP